MPLTEIDILGKKIGFNNPIFLIAEAGVNHNGELSLAKKMVDIAVDSKVDAIKFQTFKTEKLILKSTPKANYQKKDDNDKEDFYNMIKKYELTRDEFISLNNYCKKKGIIFLSTPFDEISVEWLDDLNVPAYKVGSGDMNNFPLLKLICSKRKPILLSTGMATLKEVKESVEFLKLNNIDDLVIFQCTTNYPAPYEELNLNVIDTFKQEFPNNIIGFSDHSLDIEASIGAVSKGVKVIEKHFTLNKDMEGPDHKASLNPEGLRKWVNSIRNIEKAMGNKNKKPTLAELEIAKVARKSIVSLINIKKGDIFTVKNLTVKRPGNGISPNNYYKILGRRAKRDINLDSIINWEDIE